MRAVLALLLGLLSITIASDDTETDDSGEVFSWDSDDSDHDPATSYNGLVVQAYNPTDGNPVVTLGTALDNHEETYCLTLIRVFEATGYDLTATTSTDSDYTEVTDSSVDLSDANCTISETSDTTFSISCNDVNGGSLTFAFEFVTNLDGDEGLEYTILLEDYTFVQDDSQLVLAQSVKECSDLYAYSADSGSDSDDTDDTDDESTDDSSTETPDRRLLSDDDDETEDTDTSTDDTDDTESDSADEESGISSDDSNEYDSGYAQFIVNGQAYDDCDGTQTAINSSLVYNTDDEVLHIVFDHFDCSLFIDPYVGVDNSKLVSDSGVSGVYVMIASLVGLIGALLF